MGTHKIPLVLEIESISNGIIGRVYRANYISDNILDVNPSPLACSRSAYLCVDGTRIVVNTSTGVVFYSNGCGDSSDYVLNI